jgi:hypothetical protein
LPAELINPIREVIIVSDQWSERFELQAIASRASTGN